MRWVRLNIDFDDSPWVFVLAPESQLAWVKLLCHMKRDGAKGTCKALAPLVAAKKWGVGEESVVKMLQAAVGDGALISDDGQWTLVNWREFQDSDPAAAERMRKMREKNANVTDVTRNTKNVTRNKGVTCHATETETETETVSNYKQEEGGGLESGFFDLLKTVPKYENCTPSAESVSKLIEQIRSKAPDDDAIRWEFSKFADWHTSHNAKKSSNPDPVAAFRNWVGNCLSDWAEAKERNSTQNGVKPKLTIEERLARLKQIKGMHPDDHLDIPAAWLTETQ